MQTLYARKWKGEKAHPFRGSLEVFAQSASGRHWLPIAGPNGQIRSWKSACFSSVVHITLWHRTLKEAFCILMLATQTWSAYVWKMVWSQIYQCVAGMRFSDSLLCLQWTKRGYRAYSRLYLWSHSVVWAGYLVSWLLIIPLFLQAPPLPCQYVMTVRLLEHAAVVKWMLADCLKGLYCSGMHGSDKGSVREVLLTSLLVKCCDRAGLV